MDQATCVAVVVAQTQPPQCYARMSLGLNDCFASESHAVYVKPMPPSAPPPPLPPPSQARPCGGSSVADCLNRRFREGLPSSDIGLAGVLLHVNDGSVDENAMPREEFVSGSIVSAAYGSLFGSGFPWGGFILNPRHVQLYCAWGTDGGTYGRLCSQQSSDTECVPGCTAPSGPGADATEWCRVGLSFCPYKPRDLKKMLTGFAQWNHGQYNEIIIRSDAWRRDPKTIEAVWGGVNVQDYPHVNFDPSNKEAPFS